MKSSPSIHYNSEIVKPCYMLLNYACLEDIVLASGWGHDLDVAKRA